MRGHQRNILCRQKGDNSGKVLFQEALQSGRAAMGLPQNPSLKPGDLLDLIVIKPDSLLWKSAGTSNLLATLIYSTSPSDFDGVITSGQWVVKGGKHVLENSLLKDWVQHIDPLRSELHF